jgi:hypothetical protein
MMSVNQTNLPSPSLPNDANLLNVLSRHMMLKSSCGLTSGTQARKKRALHESDSSFDHESLKRCRLNQTEEAPNGTSKVSPSKIGLRSYEINDVLSGRGGGTNQHEGNCFFRSLINKNREKYLRAKKNDKPFISLSIVNIVRKRNGRFLKKDESSGLWFEIGDAAAREKTSQALRQRAPEYRKQLFQQDNELLQRRTLAEATKLPLYSTPPMTPVSGISSLTSSDVTNTSPLMHKSGNDIILQALRASVRQAQIEEAQKALRLQQKLNRIKTLELLLKSTNSNFYSV